MPLETVLSLDVAEALADLVRLDAMVVQCLPPHVCSALKSSCMSFDSEALADRAASASRDATGRTKQYKRIHDLLCMFERRVATKGKIPRATAGDVVKMYRITFDTQVPLTTETQIKTMWEETRWVGEVEPSGMIADFWQAAHRCCALTEIDGRCEVVGLILLHATFLQVRGTALPWSLAIPLVAPDAYGPEAVSPTARDIIDRCRRELPRLIPACHPDPLRHSLRRQAIQDCRQERVGPVIDAMFEKSKLPRGEVRVLAQVSDRSARRDIHLLLETGWAKAYSTKGPLRLVIPQTAAQTVMDHAENTSV